MDFKAAQKDEFFLEQINEITNSLDDYNGLIDDEIICEFWDT